MQKLLHHIRKYVYLSGFICLLLGYTNASGQCVLNASNVTICAGGQAVLGINAQLMSGPVNLTNTISSWTWEQAGTPIGSSQNIVVTPSLTTTYTVTVQGACGTATDNVIVTVVGSGCPNAAFPATPGVICSGTNLAFTSTSTPVAGSTYFWLFDQGPTSTLANPSHVINAPVGTGIYPYPVILAVTNGGVMDVVQQNITVQQEPNPATVNSNQLVPYNNDEYLVSCFADDPSGTIFIDGVNSSAGGWVQSWSLDWGDGSPVINPANFSVLNFHSYSPGVNTLTITMNGPNGCSVANTYPVFVGNTPAVNLGSPGNTETCGPFTFNFPILDVGGNPEGTTYTVTFSDGGATQTYSHPPPASITYEFLENSCGFTTISNQQNAFYVEVTAQNPCQSAVSTVGPIRISSLPEASFAALPTPACVNLPVTITNTSDPGTIVTAATCISDHGLLWSISPATGWTLISGTLGSDNGQPLNFPAWTTGTNQLQLSFAAAGNYTVTQIIRNACGQDVETRIVCVVEPISTSFHLGYNDQCAPETITTQNLTQPLTGCGVPLFTWSISPFAPFSANAPPFTASSFEPSWDLTVDGDYTITLTAINGCGTYSDDTVFTIVAPPTLTLNPILSGCTPYSVDPSATYYDGGGSIVSQEWQIDNGGWIAVTPSEPVDYPPINFNTGTHTIAVRIANECGTTTRSQTFVVTDPPVLDIADFSMCSGSLNYVNNGAPAVLNGTGAAPFSYVWTVPGNVIPDTSNPTIQIFNTTDPPIPDPQIISVTVTDAVGCSATDNITVTVLPLPLLNSTPEQFCEGADSLQLNANSNIAAVDLTWSPATGLSGTSGSTVMASPSATITYTISAEVQATGCLSSSQITVTVNPIPFVDAGPPLDLCSQPIAIILPTPTPTGGIWTDPSPSTGNLVQPDSYVPPLVSGNDSLVYTFTDSNGCPNSDTLLLTISAPVPTDAGPDFDVCNNFSEIELTSGTPAGGVWTGTGVNQQGSSFYFDPDVAGPGIQTLLYTINGGNSCAAIDSLDVLIYAVPTVSAGIDQTICSGDSVTFAGNVNGGTLPYEYQWTPLTGVWGNSDENVFHVIVNNITGVDQLITYTFQITDSNSCIATDAVDLTIHPSPVVDAGADESHCNQGIAFSLSGYSPVSGADGTGVWTGSAALSGDVYTPPAIVGQETLTYTFTDQNGCIDSASKTITLAAPVFPDAGPDYGMCFNSNDFIFTPADQPGGIWSGAGIATDGTFDPSDAGDGDHFLYYTIFSGTSCQTTDSLTVTVHQIPIVTAADPYICTGDTITVVSTVNSGLPPYLYQWTSAGAFIGSTLTDSITITGVNPGPGNTTTQYTLAVTDGNNCNVSAAITLTVRPLPLVSAGLDSTICFSIQSAHTLQGNSPAGGSWLNFPGNSGTVAGDQFQTGGLGNDSLSYTFTDGFGCSATDTLVLTVISPEIIDAGPDLGICITEQPVLLPIAQPANQPPVYTATWTGTGVSTIAGSFYFDPSVSGVGTFTLRYTYEFGSTCAATDEIDVYVGSLPQVNVSDLAGCHGTAVNVNATLIPASGTAPFTYDWQPATNFGNNQVLSPDFTGDNTTGAATIENITLTIGDSVGCLVSEVVQITINPLPAADAGLDITLCNQPIPYTLTGFTPSGGTWSGSTNISGNIFTPGATGTETLTYTYTDANGCNGVDQIDVTIASPVFPSAGSDYEVCISDTAFLLTPATQPGGIWSGTGVSIIGTQYYFSPEVAGAGEFTIRYTILSNTTCQTTDSIVVSVNDLPEVKLGPDMISCINDACIQITDFIPSSGFGIVPATGAFSAEGIISAGGLFCPTLNLPGDQEIYYQYTEPATGCSNRDTLVMSVHPAPIALFSIDSVFCLGSPEIPENLSSGDSLYFGAIQFEWTVFNSQMQQYGNYTGINPVITIADLGNYTIQLEVTSDWGCSSVFSKSVVSVEAPLADFSISSDSGCAPVSIQIINNSNAFGPNYSWTVENIYSDSTAAPAEILFPSPILGDTVYTVHLRLENQCGFVELDKNFNARPTPVSFFNPNAPSGCSPFSPVFTNISYGAPLSFTWIFSDGFTSQDPVPPPHYLVAIDNDTTIYTVTLVSENACGNDSLTLEITVLPNTVSAFFNTDPPFGCAPLLVDFTNFSANAVEYSWNFGDGSPEVSSTNATHVFQDGGLTTIRLVANDGCSWDTAYSQVNVFPRPQMDFLPASDAICFGNTLALTNLSVGTVASQWIFGDGETSIAFEPEHSYATPGPYEIELIGYSAVFGCPDTSRRTIDVQQIPLFDVVADPFNGCMPLNVNFTNNTSFSTGTDWDFGNGTTSSALNPSTFYPQPGEFSVQITAHNFNFANNLDCLADTNIIISVFPKPLSNFTLAANASCGSVANIPVSNLSQDGESYLWQWPEGFSLQFEPVITIIDTGVTRINLITSNAFSCSDTSYSDYVLTGQPTPALRIMPATGCAPHEAMFSSLSAFGDEWSWDFGDGTTSTQGPQVYHEYEDAGNYTISLSIGNDNACFADTIITQAVFVAPNAKAAFSITPEEISEANPVVFFVNQSANATAYTLFPGDGSSYPDFISQHLYETLIGDEFQVMLVATNEFSCPDTAFQNLTILPSSPIYIPSAFTPNGNGLNEQFGPSVEGNPSYFNFLIFDRWGHVVFESFNKDYKWDGSWKNNGTAVKSDVYVYKLVVGFGKDVPTRNLVGNVTVVY